MAQHVVKVVDDGTLATDEGWAMARSGGTICFLVERSAATDERVLTDAWEAANQLEQENAAIERAVLRGIA